jgi:hypothetical protein
LAVNVTAVRQIADLHAIFFAQILDNVNAIA